MCHDRPAESETFDVEGMYEHIGMWNRRFVNECRQQDMRDDTMDKTSMTTTEVWVSNSDLGEKNG